MRNAATSPARSSDRKSSDNTKKVEPVDETVVEKSETPSPEIQKVVLEKSKSLSDSRPVRQLRTTRSLSPRPPIQHQQAIIISNENDVVLHVTDYDDEVFTAGPTNTNSLQLRGKPRGKAHSEHTSPNLSGGSFFAHDNRFANNRSTGCLVYVPSDPWIQQSGSSSPRRHHKTKPKNPPPAVDNDPWIQRRSTNDRKTNLNNSNCQIKPLADDARKLPATPIPVSPRPKLQRSKTPAVTQSDDKLPPPPPSPPKTWFVLIL